MRSVLAAVAFLAIAAAGTARADTLVLRPAAGKQVKPRYARRALASVTNTAGKIAGAQLAAAAAAGDRDALSCSTDLGCLVEIGKAQGADRVLGIRILRVKRKLFELTLVLVDSRAEIELARKTHLVTKDKLKRRPGAIVAALLADNPAPEVPELAAKPVAKPAADVDPDTEPSQAADEPQRTDAASGDNAAVEQPSATKASAPVEIQTLAPRSAGVQASATDAHTWQLGTRVGALLPRGDLAAGVLLGLEFTMALSKETPVKVHVGLDWVRLTQQDSTLVSPPNYPRGRVDLIQESNVISAYLGASYELIRLGPADLYAGAAVGLAANRSSFSAFNMTVAHNDVAVLFGTSIGARGPMGAVQWQLEFGWRETTHDLGDSGDFGETTMSGIVAVVGLSYQR